MTSYRFTINNTLSGRYLIQVLDTEASNAIVAADTVRLLEEDGVYPVEALREPPAPQYVLSGIDNGVGEPGTLIIDSCSFNLPSGELTDELASVFPNQSQVVLLDEIGGRTNQTGTVIQQKAHNYYLVRLSNNELRELYGSWLAQTAS